MRRGLLVSAALLAAAATVVFTHRDQAHAAWDSLRRVPLSTLAAALTLVLCQVALQALRLWAILPRDAALTLWRVAHAFTVGEWVNIFAPARAGDALKVVLLNRAAPGQSVPLAQAAGAVLADKIVDAGSLVLLCATSGITGVIGAQAHLRAPGPWMILGAALGLALLWLVVRRARPAWLERFAGWRRELARGLAALKDPVKLVVATAFSLGAWLAEVLALRVLSVGIGTPVSFPLIVLALAILNVGISVPLGVANLGVYETALAVGLQHAGAPLASAVAIATLHHGLELLGTNLGAAVFTVPVPVRYRWRTWSREGHTLS